jgi:hypothetical protein
MNSLQVRLLSLRRRWRLVVTVRGLCRLLTFLSAGAALSGGLDYGLRHHLPSLVRAAALTGVLGGVGYIAFRQLVLPLRVPADDLALALRIEALYPNLKDALASTVQFLEAPEDDRRLGSPSLRRQAVQQTLEEVADLDFRSAVGTRGLPSAGLSLLATAGLVLLVAFLYPTPARTALERLANPFGSREWPRQTRLEVQAPVRVARGEPVEIRAAVSGKVPPQGVLEFVDGEGRAAFRQSCTIYPGKTEDTGSLIVRRERVDRTFRFQVRANDAASDWREVVVLPPPVLVPLDGRASPQVHLEYPAYTDLPPQDLPDGSGNVEAVAGTRVTLRAATDRTVARAWVEYRPEPALVGPAAFLGSLASLDPVGVSAALVCGQEVWGPVPVHLDSTGRQLSVEFLPRISGTFALRFEDESGLGNTRLFDLRIFRDPEPKVNLVRPSSAYDSLDVLPGADVPLQVLAEDPQFALRSVFLEYRCQKGAPARRLHLYDYKAVGLAVPQLLAALAGHPTPVPALRLRPQRLHIDRRLSLDRIKHADGSALKEGDVVALQGCADDFDNVTLNKELGRSHEVELCVVSRSRLEATLAKAQAQVQQELVRLHQMQQEALRQVIGAEQQWRNTGRLRDRDMDQLFQAEQLQQQIRARVGTPREGLRAEVARLLNAFRDNHLPRSGAQNRMETVGAELDRLARNALEQIEPRLTRARKEQETSPGARKPAEGEKGPLGEARQSQEEVENTLAELLKLLEPWSDINEVRGEAKTILQEQRQLHQETEKMAEGTLGENARNLDDEHQAALGKNAALQKKLAERTNELLRKMDRLSGERRDKDAAVAEALKAAARQGAEADVAGRMKAASEAIKANKLETAGQTQQEAVQALEGVIQTVEERREQELDRLRKKLQEAENQLSDLSQRQDLLRKKMQEARQRPDSPERRQELNRLAREQEKLRKETQELLRALTRLHSERARQALSDAGDAMDEVARQLSRNEPAEEAQEETLDRLNEARQALNQEKGKVEEELAREKLARVADQIKGLKERQQAAVTEGERIYREALQRKEWDRGLSESLKDLAAVQQALGGETESLAEGKLAGAQVFARILARSAEAMKHAAEHLERAHEQAGKEPGQVVPETEAPKLQREALDRLTQLLDALKPEQGLAAGTPGSSPPGGNARSRGAQDGISFLAQLKALRALHEEVTERTKAFANDHPDLTKLSADELRELQKLSKDEQEIKDLLQQLTSSGDLEKGNP